MQISRVLTAMGVAARSEVSPPAAVVAPAGVLPPARDPRDPVGVTLREAHSLDAVYRAMFILQTTASQLTMDVRRGGTLLDPTPSLVSRPDLDQTGVAFWAETVASLACRGNAFWLRRAGADGTTIALKCLHPLEVAVWRNKYDEVIYSWRGKDYRNRGDGIAHLKLLRLPGELLGLGPIQAAARGLAGQLTVSAYGDSWFDTTDIPGGLLKTTQQLTPSQATEWKRQWRDSVRAGETAVLGGGLDYDAIMLNPAEAQWIESQKFGTTAIARLFGIPPRLLVASVDGNSMTYSNTVQEDLQFTKFTLMRYVREMEATMTDILPRGQESRFNIDAFLRPDTKTRYEAHQIGIQAGFLSTEEVRQIEGLSGPAPTPPPDPATAPTSVPMEQTQ